MPCGGHAWSLDGLTWSNQTVGAFGPVLRFTDGSYFHGAFAERPQILQAADRTPIAFYMGFGEKSYMDSHNWAQLFCTADLDPSKDCGPQLPVPPPPPTPAAPKQNGRCLITNATFPCPGGWAETCPILLGDCSDATASWAWVPNPTNASQRTLSNTGPAYAGSGSVLNIDCSSCATGTILKITKRADYASPFSYAAGTLTTPACPGMCVSGTAATQRPPCKSGEWTSPVQAVLVPCTDPLAQGWTM